MNFHYKIEVEGKARMEFHKGLREHLKNHIQQIAQRERVFGPATALIAYGKMYEPSSAHPRWLIAGESKACFLNCTSYALTRSDVYYTEGYAIDPMFPLPIQHAWLADGQGNVFDPTWEHAGDHAYFGISFRKDFVKDIVALNGNQCGILVDPVLMRRNFGSRELIENAMVEPPPKLAIAKMQAR